MRPSNPVRLLIMLALLATSIAAVPAAWAQAIITNGTVTLGVNPEAHLNVDGVVPSSVFGETIVGLRSETNLEALSHGSPCEGWGVGLLPGSTTPGFSGWANRCFDGFDEDGPVNNVQGRRHHPGGPEPAERPGSGELQ